MVINNFKYNQQNKRDTNKKVSRGGDYEISRIFLSHKKWLSQFWNFVTCCLLYRYCLLLSCRERERERRRRILFRNPPPQEKSAPAKKSKLCSSFFLYGIRQGGVLYLQLNLLASAGISQKWVWMHTNFHRIGTRNWVVSSQVPQNDVLDRGIHNGGWKRRSLFSRPVNGLVTYYY